MKLRKDKVANMRPTGATSAERRYQRALFARLRVDGAGQSLPFVGDDTTVGTESELQTAVLGNEHDVDLALTIKNSNFYANIVKRGARGESPRRLRSDLEKYLHENRDGVWENSQVRVPAHTFNAYASQVLRSDLYADKKEPQLGLRGDAEKFLIRHRDVDYVRMPVSYLIKFALADALGADAGLPALVRDTGARLLHHHLLNDNTSPEQLASYVTPMSARLGNGRAVAKETAQRFLLTQLLVSYANEKLQLKKHGQECQVYYSALPPARQKRLNECVSDTYYRELFMNPCLSGWDRGEPKHDYMHLCHSVLSRSHMNTMARLRDARIIKRNLVVVPTLSNTSLANNGTHISLGSIKLSRAFATHGGKAHAGEKYLGDLAIKTVEHFLPLFVGTYSAAPHRLDFAEFHPERVLAFLPHELDDAHLRMLWQSWKRKADILVLKHPLTPFGMKGLDRTLAAALRLRGDHMPDYRLLDYFVSLLSTDQSPALNGIPGNGERLKKDLSELGVFDAKMTMYLPYRLREHAQMGFSGFEGRYYSVFETLSGDLAQATELQQLVTALAYKYMANGTLGHSAIPDRPEVESERRQFFFAAAIGLPFCYVRKDTGNMLLRRILTCARRVRPSKFYSGYLKVRMSEYRRALLRVLEEDAADLIEMMGLRDTMNDLHKRLEDPSASAAARSNAAILESLNARHALDVNAHDYNRATEDHYRNTLRVRHLQEGMQFLLNDALEMDSDSKQYDGATREALRHILGEGSALQFVSRVQADVIAGTVEAKQLLKLIQLVLLGITVDANRAAQFIADKTAYEATSTSIYRAGNG